MRNYFSPFLYHISCIYVQDVEPSANWPSKGQIQFKNVSLRYDKKLDPVVTDIYLVIKPGQKVK